MLSLGWLTSARGSGSRGFFEIVQKAIESGTLQARFEFIFSNREYGEGEASDRFFDRVSDLDIPLVNLSSRRFIKERGGGKMRLHRDAFHSEVMRLIGHFKVDVCVLAGYMLIVSDEMCRQYNLINLHPALPSGPSGTWKDVIWELITTDAVENGVMVHVATEDLDAGPVLTYCRFPIRGPAYDPLWSEASKLPISRLRDHGETQPLFSAIRQEGMLRERPLLLETLRVLADGRLCVRERIVTDSKGVELVGGMCLVSAVDANIRADPKGE